MNAYVKQPFKKTQNEMLDSKRGECLHHSPQQIAFLNMIWLCNLKKHYYATFNFAKL